MRSTLLLLLFVCACSQAGSEAAVQNGAQNAVQNGMHFIRSVDLRPSLQGATITIETGRFHGILEVEPGLVAEYRKVATTSAGQHEETTTVTIDGRELVIESRRIRLGKHAVGPLEGEVRIDVRKDGVYVDGQKKSAF